MLASLTPHQGKPLQGNPAHEVAAILAGWMARMEASERKQTPADVLPASRKASSAFAQERSA